MDEELFPANYSISKADEEDGNYDSGSECEEDDEEEEQANAAFTVEEEDLDVYEVDNEWGTLVTDESNGIFDKITVKSCFFFKNLLLEFYYSIKIVLFDSIL